MGLARHRVRVARGGLGKMKGKLRTLLEYAMYFAMGLGMVAALILFEYFMG